MAARSRSKAGRSKRSHKHIALGGPLTPPLLPADDHDALAAHLTKDRMDAFTAALQLDGGVRSVKALYMTMKESYDQLYSLQEELELEPPIACTSGCIYCCYNQIAITEPEALFIGMHLLETRDRQQLQDLEVKTRELVDKLKGKSWQDIGMARHTLQCLFLENGNCGIYPARPLSCRGWNSVNVNMCRESNLSENALTQIEHHAILREMAHAMQNGILHGSRALGLEAGYLLMGRAVLLLLENGAKQGLLTSMDDWLNGMPFFARKKDW